MAEERERCKTIRQVEVRQGQRWTREIEREEERKRDGGGQRERSRYRSLAPPTDAPYSLIGCPSPPLSGPLRSSQLTATKIEFRNL